VKPKPRPENSAVRNISNSRSTRVLRFASTALLTSIREDRGILKKRNAHGHRRARAKKATSSNSSLPPRKRFIFERSGEFEYSRREDDENFFSASGCRAARAALFIRTLVISELNCRRRRRARAHIHGMRVFSLYTRRLPSQTGKIIYRRGGVEGAC